MNDTPHWPTVGSCLTFFFEIAGLNEKEQDPKGTWRRTIHGIATEDEQRIEQFFDTFALIADRLEILTEGEQRHWLSGAAFTQLVASYQWLVKTIPCPTGNQQIIEREFVRVLTAFTMELYFKWLRDDLHRTRSEPEDLWFLPGATGFSEPLKQLMVRVCRHLGLEASTAHALAVRLYEPSDSLDHAKRTFQNWFSGSKAPHSATFYASIIHKLDDRESRLVRLDYLAFSWGRKVADLLEKAGCSEEWQALASQVQSISSIIFGRPKNTPPHLPSLLIADSPSLVEWEQALLRKYTHPLTQRFIQVLQWSLDEARTSRTLDDLSRLTDLADKFRYRLGTVWVNAVSLGFEIALELNDESQRPLHKQLVLLGNLGTKYKVSENWREYQRNPIPPFVSSGDMAWCRDLSRAYRNELRRVGRYDRTQLQVAITWGTIETVRQLLEHGADPAVRVVKDGDNATSLLMSFQISGQDSKARRPLVELLLAALDLRSREIVQASINARTTIKNQSAFSLAIETGDSWSVQAFLDRGADVEAPIGSDENSPLYLAMNQVLLAYRASHDPEFFEKTVKMGVPGMNQTRLASPLPGSLILNTLEADRPELRHRVVRAIVKELLAQSSLDERLAIVRTLLARGSDPNRLQRLQRRYPLDFAVEIDQETSLDLTALVRNAGGHRVSLY